MRGREAEAPFIGAAELINIAVAAAKGNFSDSAFFKRHITGAREKAANEELWDEAIDTSRESTKAVLKRLSEEGHGVDIAIDCLGGKNMGECLKYLNCCARNAL